MITEYLMYIQERYDYTKEHGHDLNEIGSILWHFHNKEHGYKHCKGPPSNPYKIEHHGKIHIISKQYARGHGLKKVTQWFKFTKKIKSGWWELDSGTKVLLNKVPTTFKKKD